MKKKYGIPTSKVYPPIGEVDLESHGSLGAFGMTFNMKHSLILLERTLMSINVNTIASAEQYLYYQMNLKRNCVTGDYNFVSKRP